jgi:hypothetical protein
MERLRNCSDMCEEVKESSNLVVLMRDGEILCAYFRDKLVQGNWNAMFRFAESLIRSKSDGLVKFTEKKFKVSEMLSYMTDQLIENTNLDDPEVDLFYLSKDQVVGPSFVGAFGLLSALEKKANQFLEPK